MAKPLRLLVIDGSAIDPALIAPGLREAGFAPEWVSVKSEVECLDRLAEGWDLIIAPSRSSPLGAASALRLLRERGLDIPVIVVANGDGEEPAATWLREGAADFVRTDRLPLLGSQVARALKTRKRRRRESREEAALPPGEERYRRAIALADAVAYERRFGEPKFRYIGEGIEALTGYRPEELTIDLWRSLIEEAVPRGECLGVSLEEAKARVFSGEVENWRADYLIHTRTGEHRWLADSSVQILDAEGKPLGSLGILQDITERVRAEGALRHSEERFRVAAERASDLIYEWNITSGEIEWFGDIDAKLGYAPGEFPRTIAAWEGILHPDDRERVLDALGRSLGEGGLFDTEYRVVRKDGAILTWHERGTVLPDAEDAPGRMIGACSDITERRSVQEQLVLSQKMEAVGQLAGGVAHDFNNLLLCILGFADLALESVLPEDPLSEDLQEIRRAAQRAAALTRQLLAFSRRQLLQPVNLDLNELIGDLLKMLQRLIGEDIELEFLPGEKLELVHVDPGQTEQVIMNLAVNARDAMPLGGKLTIQTQSVHIEPEYCAMHPWAREGRHVALTVTDTGTGMPSDVQRHIFEPFFTTKEVGKGTGLGLATVYGIVKQHGGMINVYSEPGMGSTFKIYLPVAAQAHQDRDREAHATPPRGTETILVAEDEEMVRNLAVRILGSAGYTVLTARDGLDAVEVFEAHRDQIALVILDMVMPKMSGTVARDRMRTLRPDLRCLFTSGYSASTFYSGIASEEDFKILPKPYDAHTLLRRVRDLLDSEASRAL